MPNDWMESIHNRAVGDAIVFDAFRFCMDVTDAATKWFKTAKRKPNVRKNLSGLVQYRPNGISPYIVGLPVIA